MGLLEQLSEFVNGQPHLLRFGFQVEWCVSMLKNARWSFNRCRMNEEQYYEELRLQHYHEEYLYQQWLTECVEVSTSAGCPDGYVVDEQRWRAMFDAGMSPEDAVEEDLTEGAQ